MDADRLFAKNGDEQDAAGAKPGAAAAGATGLFQTISPEQVMGPTPDSGWQTVPAGGSQGSGVEGTGARVEQGAVQAEVGAAAPVMPVVTAAATPPAAALPPAYAMPVQPAPVPIAPSSAPLQNAGFTQLLRALNYEQVRPEAVAAPKPASTVPVLASLPVDATTGERSGLEGLPAVMSAPSAPSAASAFPAPPVPPLTISPQVTSFGPPVPVTVPASAPAPAPSQISSPSVSPTAGSFTQMFEQMDAGPGATDTAVPLHDPITPKADVQGVVKSFEGVEAAASASPSGSVPAPVAAFPAAPLATAAAPVVPAPLAPGSFTQMFQSLAAAEGKQQAVAPPAASVESGPGALTAVFMVPTGGFGAAPAPRSEAAAAPAPAVAAELPASFTQIFGVLAEEPAAATPPVKEQVPAAQATPAAEAPPSVPPPPAVPDPSSFTQMFSVLTMESPAAAAVAPQPVPLPTAAPAAPPPQPPGSFTQMFRTLSAEPQPNTEPQPEAKPLAVQPGSTTGMFQTMGGAAAPRAVEADPAPPLHASAEAQPASFTQMFSAVSSPPTAGGTPAADSATGSGSFTEVFRTLGAAAPEAAHATSPAGSFAPAAPPQSVTDAFRRLDPDRRRTEPELPLPAHSGGGSFTDIFRSLDEGPVPLQPPPSGGPRAAAEETPRGQAETFTQIFRTLDAPAASSPAPRASTGQEPGSFTQMFGVAPADAARSASPYTEPGAAGSYPPAAPDAGRPRETFSPVPARPLSSAAATTPAAGGLTQLLRTLDTPSQPMGSQPPAPRPAAAPAAPSGSFTAVYGRLEGSEAPAASTPPAYTPPAYTPPANAGRDATQAFRLPASPQPVMPAVAAGPSEFTRILTASQLREMGLRGEGAAAAAGTAPVAAQPAAGMAMPQLSMPSMPAMPQAPRFPAAGHGAAAPVVPQMPVVPHVPAAPQLPQVKLPEVPKATAPAGMQQYLPLLLILVIFLLVAVLVAVFFLIKK